MEKEERKLMFKKITEIFKNLGFEVSKNKKVYVIEYPEVYVRIGLDVCRGATKLMYLVLFKKIHHPCDYFNEGNYDTTLGYTLNADYGAADNFHFFLEDIPFYRLAETINQMLEKYIYPFKEDPYKAIKDGKQFLRKDGTTYTEKYMLCKDAALALNIPELAAPRTHSSIGFDNCIGYEDLEGVFVEPKSIKDKAARQRVEERIRNQQKQVKQEILKDENN